MIVSDGLLFAISPKHDYNPHPISQYRDQFMNQLDQLGMRISHIDSAFDQWIKQQNTNYNTFAVLYTLATEGSHTQKYIGEEWSLPKQTVSGTCKTLAEQGLLTFHESEQDKR